MPVIKKIENFGGYTFMKKIIAFIVMATMMATVAMGQVCFGNEPSEPVAGKTQNTTEVSPAGQKAADVRQDNTAVACTVNQSDAKRTAKCVFNYAMKLVIRGGFASAIIGQAAKIFKRVSWQMQKSPLCSGTLSPEYNASVNRVAVSATVGVIASIVAEGFVDWLL